MNCPPQITDALEVLDREQERVALAIAKKLAENANLYTMADEDYHELMGLHRKRDRMANVTNNLRAYYGE